MVPKAGAGTRAGRGRRRVGRWLGWSVAALGLFVAVAEAASRRDLRFGQSALLVPDPLTEYRFAPNQSVRPYGKLQSYNALGMRSGPVPDTGEVVLVFGDSVVNGGGVGQEELATGLLQARLKGRGEDVYVGNVAAASWGPANILGWIDKFGLLRARRAVVVLSSHDLTDNMTYAPLDCSIHPTRRPPLALIERLRRTLPKYLPEGVGRMLKCRSNTPIPMEGRRAMPEGEAAVAALIARLVAAGVPTCIVLHSEVPEMTGDADPDQMTRMRAALGETGLPVIEEAELIRASGRAPREIYRDRIHLNALGQGLLAEALGACLERMAGEAGVSR